MDRQPRRQGRNVNPAGLALFGNARGLAQFVSDDGKAGPHG